jgi:SAM-dependent methyltransferase
MSSAQSAWELFFRKTVTEALAPGSHVLDIGGGLRVDGNRGNVVDPRNTWIKPLLEKVTYRVLDPVDTYHPDIIGDVMAMALPNNSEDVIFCMAVLEHVSRPWDAVKEMRRVLKPGGRLVLYVPFLSPYHAMPGYYGDFFRFTKEGLLSLCEAFNDVQIEPVRGPVETLVHLFPNPLRRQFLLSIARWMDGWRHSTGNQAAGYFVSARKPNV